MNCESPLGCTTIAIRFYLLQVCPSILSVFCCCFTHFGSSSNCFNFDKNYGIAPIAVTHRRVLSGFWSLSCLRHPAEQNLLLSSWVKRRNGGSAMQRILEQAKERFGWQGGLRLHGDKLKLTWLGGEKLEPGLAVNALADFVFALFQLNCAFQTFIPLKDSDRNQHYINIAINHLLLKHQ